MRSVVYDAGLLIAAERNDRRVWAEHRVRLELGVVPCVPAPIVAQVSRSPRQVQLRRLLRGCEVVPLDEDGAHRSGALLGKSRTTDIADVALVSLAVARMADIVTSDRADIQYLVSRTRVRIRVINTCASEKYRALESRGPSDDRSKEWRRASGLAQVPTPFETAARKRPPQGERERDNQLENPNAAYSP